MRLPPLKIYIGDIEADGLMKHQIRPGETPVTRVHCLVVKDYHTGQVYRWRNNKDDGDQIPEGLAFMAQADKLVFHNGIGYDIPALKLLYGWEFPEAKVVDTLVLSRLLYANLGDIDMGYIRSGRLPGAKFGSHGLEAWGYRTGIMKDEYAGDPLIEDPKERYDRRWMSWNQSMEDYCVQDVEATEAIYKLFMSNQHYFPEGQPEGIYAVSLEHAIKWVMCQQERNGFPFDEQGAERLYAELAGKRQELLSRLVDTFGSWWQPKGGTSPFMHPRTGKPLAKYPLVKYPKTGAMFLKDGKTLSKTPYFEGCPFTPIEHVQFNPSSRDHIAKVLKENGWVPTEFTETGKPVVDEETLGSAKVDDPKKQAAINLIAEYMIVVKRIGQLSEGKNSWLSFSGNGLIHGGINPNGAVTGRATHSNPNLAQVPSGGIKVPYGAQCRALFGAKWFRKVWPDAVQVGTDASGLELRCLGHFMARYDEGAYIDVLLNGDIHWLNVESLGLVPNGTKRVKARDPEFEPEPDPVRDPAAQQHDAFRNMAKTFIYAFLYGAGDEKIGSIVEGGKTEGKRLKDSFMAATPAIASLREAIKISLVESEKWVGGASVVKWKRKWLKGLDGRKLHVRSPHSALNTLLQSAGALACKLWAVETIRVLTEEYGLRHGNTKDDDFMLCAWVHDELQLVCKNREVAQKVSDASAKAMAFAGEKFGFKCPLATEAKVGDTWLECH